MNGRSNHRERTRDDATHPDALPVEKLATHRDSADVYQAIANISQPSRRRRRRSQNPQWTADGRRGIYRGRCVHSRVHDSRDVDVTTVTTVDVLSLRACDSRARHGRPEDRFRAFTDVFSLRTRRRRASDNEQSAPSALRAIVLKNVFTVCVYGHGTRNTVVGCCCVVINRSADVITTTHERSDKP